MYTELLSRLNDERQRVWSEYRHELEGFDVSTATAETRAKLDRMDVDLAELDKRIKTVRDQAGIEATAAEAREGADRIVRNEARGEERNELGWSKLEQALRGPKGTQGVGFDLDLRGLAGGAEGFEKRAERYEERVLSETFAAGGALVPTEFSPLLYRYLIQNSAIRQTNVRVITTATGDNFVQPSYSAYSAEATIVSAGAAIGASDPAFTSATLGAYKFGTLWQVQYELLQDSAYNLLNELAFQFGRALANGEGKKFVLGTGTSEPNGVVHAAGTVYQLVGGTPASSGPTYANLVDTMHKVIPPYRVNSYWMFNDKTLAVLRKLTDTNGRPLWTPGLAGFGVDVPDTLLGKPYVIDPYVPDIGVAATSIVYGDFSGYMIREVAGIRLERSDDYAFNSDLATFRILHRVDGNLIDTNGAVATFKGGTA
jgi:HK97 family phage major capsid protein